MAKANINEENPDEWGEFLHLPGQKFHDFGKIRDEIVRDTDKMTGKNAGQSRLSSDLVRLVLIQIHRYLTQPNQSPNLLTQCPYPHSCRSPRSNQSTSR